MNRRANKEFSAECRRCGTCCKKGGPTLHAQDRELVKSGAVPLRLLVTIREGEIVREPEGGGLVRADSEMIKFKGTSPGWTCVLFDEPQNRCTEYDRRPSECRAMACWDTEQIERIMKTPPLSRRDLLSGVEGIWDLICAHEKRCGIVRMHELSVAIRHRENRAEGEMMEMLRYDKALRDLLVERKTDAGHLDFLLGRPLNRLLGGFGLKLVLRKGRTGIALL